MKNAFAGLVCSLFSLSIFAQTTSDSTIYAVADTMPMALLSSCQPSRHVDWNLDSVRHCSEATLLSIVAQNIRYPQEAREKNVQGMVVITFVVERNGLMNDFKILKDIGSGCGDEAVRVLKALGEAGLRWMPGRTGGKFVRTQVSLPLKFKLEEAKPFILNEFGDSVYVQFDQPAVFRGGLDSLAKYIVNHAAYPLGQLDSCKTGVVEMSLLVFPDGSVRVDNQLDFNNLGGDFQFNAIRLANRTAGKWESATFAGKAVTTSATVRVPYKSPAASCATANAAFEQALLLADEAVNLTDAGNAEASLAKINEALALHPRNTEFLYYRANIYLGMSKKEEACADFTTIKSILGTTWFEAFGRIICGW